MKNNVVKNIYRRSQKSIIVKLKIKSQLLYPIYPNVSSLTSLQKNAAFSDRSASKKLGSDWLTCADASDGVCAGLETQVAR